MSSPAPTDLQPRHPDSHQAPSIHEAQPVAPTTTGVVQRIVGSIPRFYLPCLVLLCIIFARRPLGGGDDFWSHAAIGRWIVEHGAVPHQTLFLWSTPPVEWVAHSWLCQVLFYGLMAVGGETAGPALALALTAIMSSLTFMLLWREWQRHAEISVLAPLLFGIAIWCSAARFRPRQELFTALFTVALLLFLIRAKERSDKTNVRLAVDCALVFGLFVLWTNMHGAVAMGLMLLGITALCDLIQGRGRSLSWQPACLLLAAAAAVVVNPYGIGYLEALRKPVDSAMFSKIDEWKPFWKSPALTPEAVVVEALLVTVALAAWWSGGRRRWAEAAWVLLMALAFVASRRHLWLLAVVALAVVAANSQVFDSQRFWEKWQKFKARYGGAGVSSIQASLVLPDGMRLAARSGLLLCLVLWVAISIPSDLFPLRACSRYLPVRGTEVLKTQKIDGRIFNDYEHSSYLQWRFGEKRPLFIDLVNAYPYQLMKDYFDISAVNQRGRKMLRQRIDYVFLGRHEPTDPVSDLAAFLNRSRDWKPVYQGPDSSIWVRRKTGVVRG